MTPPRQPDGAAPGVGADGADPSGRAIGADSPLAGRSFHMMGIGGAGVSALAQLCSAWGADVTGCDRARSSYVDLVEDVGVPVAIGHDAAHVAPGSELVVSSAVPADQDRKSVV